MIELLIRTNDRQFLKKMIERRLFVKCRKSNLLDRVIKITKKWKIKNWRKLKNSKISRVARERL